MRMEVRCCCQPTKLLGWVDIQDTVLDGRPSVSFLVRRTNFFKVALDADPVFVPTDIITLPLAKIATAPDWRGYLALKSEGTPIERLRLIKGFVENTQSL